MKTLALLLLAALPLAAQNPPSPSQAPAPASAAAPHRPLLVFAAAAAGAAAGAVLGSRAVSFAGVAPADRGAHQFRSGLVYGAIGGVLPAAAALRLEDGPGDEPHNFFWDHWNTPLLAGMAAVHALDYTSTRYFRERSKDEWLLTNSIVDSRPKFIATETAAAAAGIGLIYIFHRTGHHRLERWVAAGYISLGAASAVANYRYPATGHAIFGN
ncbi:MAG TPA: hypothetical protein VN515_05110 [Terriglobales bacterium]|nr:hypothetical protein [Terriglobales bacterium]